MPISEQHAEHHVRIFRDNPFAWYDKEVMRYLRGKYGKDKKTFLILRAVYTALTEIESDFKDSPIGFFTKTVGTYAGVSREVAGKYLNLLEQEGLITKTRERDPQTQKFLPGTTVRILSLQQTASSERAPQQNVPAHQPKKPVSGYPSTGIPQRWDTPARNKKIVSSQENISNVNEHFTRADAHTRSGMQGVGSILKQFDTLKKKGVSLVHHKEKPEDVVKRDFLAEEMAQSLGDHKSLGAFRTIAERIPETIIRDFLARIQETWRDGKVKKSRGALFISLIQQYTSAHGIDLGFQSSG